MNHDSRLSTLGLALATPLARRSRAGRGRRRLRFTRMGKYFVGLTLAVGFAAINTGNNLLYLVLGLQLAVIVGSGILSEACLRRLSFSRLLPSRVHAKTPVLIGIRIDNHGRSASYAVEYVDHCEKRPLPPTHALLHIAGKSSAETAYRHVFAHRGRFSFGSGSLQTRFPFGLFRKSIDVEHADEIVVYPELLSATRASPNAALLGDQPDQRIGRQGDFFALREFREGDDARDIYWRKAARIGRWIVRQNEENTGRLLLLVLDNHRPADELTLERLDAEEHAVSQTASLAAAYLEQGYSVGLGSRTVSVPPGRGSAQLDRLFYQLALIAFVRQATPFVGDHYPRAQRLLIEAGVR